jgi:phosphatidate cytidylyltransferase
MISLVTLDIPGRLLAQSQSAGGTVDQRPLFLLGSFLFILVSLWLLGTLVKRRAAEIIDPAIVRSFRRRVSGNLTMCLVLALALLVDKVYTVVFFGLVSFWALREFITMTPTRRADHRTLFAVLCVMTPLQYVLVGFNGYELYTVVIPVYASLFVAARVAFTDDPKRFLERIAKIQFGLFICVYALSHAPALLYLQLQRWDTTQNAYVPWTGSPAGLLIFFVVLVQLSDLLHFVWDRLVGRHVIAPNINATKTWEGLIGSGCCTAIFSMLIHMVLPVAPYTWMGAGIMGLIVAVMSSSGSMTMSAIKRDRGIQDYGTLIQGHAGVLDRIDSICFAAPIYFHVTRFFLNSAG